VLIPNQLVSKVMRKQAEQPKQDKAQVTFSAITFALAALAASMVFLDDRVILGEPLWMKPFKFFLSASLMGLTLAYLVPRVENGGRRVKLLSYAIILSLSVELVLISGAAVFETTSHFNVSSPLAIAIWGAMATFISIVWLATIALGVLFLRGAGTDPHIRAGFLWGIGISLLGMAVAFLMTGPTEAQLSDWQGIAGAHTVGGNDGGPGIPLFGWSTVAGDLRVAHFFGLHALQGLPLFAVLARALRLSPRIITIFGLGYLSLFVVLTVQALSGESVASPSEPTVWVFAAIGVFVGFALLSSIITSRVKLDN
jgi:hypothetical protein